MKSGASKRVNFERLPMDARKELMDFYEYLLAKHGKAQGREISSQKRKDRFFESVKNHTFNLPGEYRFDREEMHER
jgi:hypothetical protein